MKLFKRNDWYYIRFSRTKKRALGTKDKRTAQQLFRSIEREILKGRLIQLDQGEKITLLEFKNIFFKRHTDIADRTYDAYELAADLLIDSIGGKTLLKRIDSSKIEKFKSDCLTRKVKKVSVNTYLTHIRGFLNKAHKWGYTDKKAEIKLYKLPKRLPTIFTLKEIKAIRKYAKKNDFQMYRFIEFALWSACRRAEIANFQWQHLIDKNSTRIYGKGNKERVIPLLPGAKKAMGPIKDIGYVFEHYNDLSVYTKRFKKILRQCGIKGKHLHHLRHTAGTELLKYLSIEYVREMLGHVDLSTTEIYAKVLQKQLIDQSLKIAGNLYREGS